MTTKDIWSTSGRAWLPFDEPMKRTSRNAPPATAKPALSRPSRQAARTASATAARRRSPTTKCSSCCCSARSRGPTPSRSPRRCSTRFGTFAEVLGAPERAAAGGQGRRRGGGARPQAGGRGRPSGCCAARSAGRDDPVVLGAGDRLLPGGHGVRGARAVPHPVPRQAQRADRRRGAADRHGRPHAGLSARGGAPRAGAVGDRDRSWSTTIRRATRPRRAPTSR